MITYKRFKQAIRAGMRKRAGTLEPDDTSITQKFEDYQNKQQQIGFGAMFGPLGYLAAKAISAKSKESGPDALPEFDPATGAYIGRAYKLPEDEEGMLKLHKDIVGSEWKRSAPRVLEWLLAKRPERIRASIREALLKGKAVNADKLSAGEKASLAFPYVLTRDEGVKKGLGMLQPYPLHYGWNTRAITPEDIKKWLEKHPKN